MDAAPVMRSRQRTVGRRAKCRTNAASVLGVTVSTSTFEALKLSVLPRSSMVQPCVARSWPYTAQ